MGTETITEIKFSPEAMALVQKYKSKFPQGKHKSALLSVLHLAQVEFGGWLSPKVMEYVADVLEIKPIEVYEVATFYSMYFTHPMGKYVFEVCHTGPCQICGSDEVIEYLENKLGIQEGQTTPDGMFSIKAVECLAACGGAPMMQVGLKYHENLTHEKMDHIIDECRVENKVSRVSV